MEKRLLDKRDTDYVRDNLIFNYILGNEQELLIESYVKNNALTLRFDPSRFYFFMTGTHKKFTKNFTPDSFNDGVASVLHIYRVIDGLLRENGYDGNTFQVKEDNSKQVGVLFSPGASPALSPEAMAQRLYEGYMEHARVGKHDILPYVSTSFVGPYSGYEQIHQAFLDARELNDLIFFGVTDCVITRALRERTARPCDVTAIQGNVRRLIHLVCGGTCAQALRQADYIIDGLIAPSYSMTNFSALYTSFEDLLLMLEMVYPDAVRVAHRPRSGFYTLSDYSGYVHTALRTVFDQLAGAPRYSPTLLMALSYINRNFTRELSLTQLSEYVYANPSTLSSEFNAGVGMSLSEYVTGLRVRHAQKLLDTTDFSVPEIAQQAGFASAKYFREQFKRQTGLSPQGYRDHRGAP